MANKGATIKRWVMLSPPLPRHDEISIPRAASAAAKQPCPINDGHPGAVLRNLSSDIGLGAVVTALAPGDNANVSGEGLA